VESADADRRRAAIVVAAVLAIVVVDQVTKAWAVVALADGPKSVLGDVVELRLARNPGGAFGRFRGFTPVLAVVAAAITVVIARLVRRTVDRALLVGLVLVLGGALGNLADRIFRSPGVLRGHVVDFVSVGWWPIFNVADACITVGAVLIVWRMLRSDVPAGRAAA